MTGVCGGAGSGGRRAVDHLADRLRRFGDESEHRANLSNGAISLIGHRSAPQPVEADDGSLVWCWGQVYGHGPNYRSRRATHPDASPAAFCAHVYDESGLDEIATLNGEYALCIADPDGERIRIVMDRLGTHPVYWTRTDDGDVVFCSSLQDLAAHPDCSITFDREYLYEYFAFRRSFGVRTPLADVHRTHPGAITTIDCVDGTVETDVYWRPQYDPGSASRSAAREDYVGRFRAAVADREAVAGTGEPTVADRTVGDEPARRSARSADAPDARAGVLVSGGNDSRAVLAAMADDPIGFHVTSDESAVETRVARAVLSAAPGTTVRMLRRDEDHLAEALERNAPLCDFGSWFNQAHVYDFASELRTSCDVIFTGHYGDVYSGGPFPAASVPTPLGPLPLPVLDRPDSLSEYVDSHLDGTLEKHSHRLPAYCQTPPTAREILEANVHWDGGDAVHHGVRYGDLTDLLFAGIYPITNRHSFLFYDSLCQTMPTANPYFDYRLLDWLLEQPLGRLLRTDVQNAVIETCEPALARIPHAARGVTPRRSFPVQYASHRLQGARRRLRSRIAPSETRDMGFTTDLDEQLRSRSLVRDVVRENRDLIERYDWLDPEGIQAELDAHRDGEHRRSELFCLLTFLAMPIHEYVEPNDRVPPPRSSESLDAPEAYDARGTPGTPD